MLPVIVRIRTVSTALRMSLRLALVSLQLWFSTAYAGAGANAIDFATEFDSVSTSICNLFDFLSGPIALAICGIMVVIGLIRMGTGNRGGMGIAITALVVGIVLLSLDTILPAETCAAP